MADEAQKLLKKHKPDVAQTTMKLREVVRKNVPEAHESVKPGWKGYHVLYYRGNEIRILRDPSGT